MAKAAIDDISVEQIAEMFERPVARLKISLNGKQLDVSEAYYGRATKTVYLEVVDSE